MTTTEIRDALAAIEHAVDVPPVDEVAFQARVRTERRRRAAGRALVGVAAAAAVVAAGFAGNVVFDEPERSPVAGTPGQSDGEVRLPGTAFFFVLDGQLTALDPRGVVHDLGIHSEGVIGWTSERVYALDDESHVVVRRVEYDKEGARVLRFTEEESPVTDPVQGATLSGDGRYLAWLDNDNVVHRYDVKAEQEDLSFPVGVNTALTGVAADGVLVSENGELSLRDAVSRIPVPVQGDGYGAASDVAAGFALVNDRDGHSRLYDVSEGEAQLVESFTGFAALGPYAERVAVIVPEAADRGRVEVWDGGTVLDVTGLDGVIPDRVRWADEITLLVAGHDGSQGRLYACDIELRCGALPVEGGVGFNE